LSGPNAGFVGVGCPFVDVVGPGSDAALVVAEAGFDVVGEQGGVACGAFFGPGMAGSPVMWVVMLRSLRGAGGPTAVGATGVDRVGNLGFGS
jgi:hypothetical protein